VKGAGLVLLGLVLLIGAAFLVEAVWSPGPAADREIPLGEARNFSAPQWLAADLIRDQVSLRWRTVPGALAYTLWRSPDPEGSFRVIHMGRDTIFVDRHVPDPGDSLCYLLTATDWELGESGFSESRCVSSTK
jgi:hypothetical protein